MDYILYYIYIGYLIGLHLLIGYIYRGLYSYMGFKHI